MKNASKNTLSKLKVDGEVETNAELIEEEVVTFFKALFNGYHNVNLFNTGTPFVPNNTNLPEFLNGLGRLTDLDQKELEMLPIDIGKLVLIIRAQG